MVVRIRAAMLRPTYLCRAAVRAVERRVLAAIPAEAAARRAAAAVELHRNPAAVWEPADEAAAVAARQWGGPTAAAVARVAEAAAEG